MKEREDDIWIRVTDDGPGMTEEELRDVRSFTAIPKGHGIGIEKYL